MLKIKWKIDLIDFFHIVTLFLQYYYYILLYRLYFLIS